MPIVVPHSPRLWSITFPTGRHFCHHFDYQTNNKCLLAPQSGAHTSIGRSEAQSHPIWMGFVVVVYGIRGAIVSGVLSVTEYRSKFPVSLHQTNPNDPQ